MNKLSISLLVAGALPLALAASPQVVESSIAVSQDASTRVVSISYRVEGGPAVITADIHTNGVSVGKARWNLFGAVNRLVSGEGPHVIRWSPEDEFPDFDVDAVTPVLTAWSPTEPPPYMAVDLSLTNSTLRASRFYYADEDSVPGGVTDRTYKTTVLLMRLIPAKNVRWRMGAPTGEVGLNDKTRETIHYVTFRDDYYMSVYQLTQRQNQIITGKLSSTCRGADYPDADFHPLDYCSYELARGKTYVWPDDLHKVTDDSTIGKLRIRTGIPTFDMPTDAQWEYACRAGTGTSLNSGLNISDTKVDDSLAELAWYADNSGTHSHEVGLKKPNNWGLYDMHGNVLEWVLDYYSTGPTHYCVEGSDVVDPVGDTNPVNNYRVQRGGAWKLEARACRSAWRGFTSPSSSAESTQGGFGLRLVCAATAE